ncbi:DUF6286 domain-containing Asp23/Gls24 family envelope stress response protein [Streptomyces sp. NPDC058382]|uniref:DUF6286 domain-containing Asp23/Gls24 family envelope stress response protein n=1 Tax=unclassified Streptomyces TaxID=2593676 RepID=UPI003642DD86
MSTPAQRGTTTVSDRAVRRIVERAAAEALPGDTAGATARGSVAVRGQRARVRIGVAVAYPAPLADTVRRVQEHVTERTRGLAGLDVTRAEVRVDRLTLRAVPVPVAQPEERPARRSVRRFRSSRRVPVAVLLLAAVVGCGAVGLDVVRVHVRDRPAAGWRTGAVDWLSGHGPGDVPVVLGGAALALLGVWLVVLAVAPGQRRLLTLAAPASYPEAAVDRSVVLALVHGAVSGVAGTGRVRVRVRRRSVRVRAGLAFGDAAAVRKDVDVAARRALTGCLLGRAPRLRVRVRPEPVWHPPEPDASGRGASEPDAAGPGAREPDVSEPPAAGVPEAPAAGPSGAAPLGQPTTGDA